MSLFSSLTNRIFFGSALLAVASIAIAIYNVNVAVTRQAEQELRRGLDEAGTIIDEFRGELVEHFTREARLIADLPRLKAAVDTNDPTTVLPMAAEYQRQLVRRPPARHRPAGADARGNHLGQHLERFVRVAAWRQVRPDGTRNGVLLAPRRRHPAESSPCRSSSICGNPKSWAR